MTLDINISTAKWVEVQPQLPVLFLMTEHLGTVRHWTLRLSVYFTSEYLKNCQSS